MEKAKKQSIICTGLIVCKAKRTKSKWIHEITVVYPYSASALISGMVFTEINNVWFACSSAILGKLEPCNVKTQLTYFVGECHVIAVANLYFENVNSSVYKSGESILSLKDTIIVIKANFFKFLIFPPYLSMFWFCFLFTYLRI